jgi:hypothetical protein
MPYDNTNSGALFRDTEKKSEKAPDYTGKLDVDGREYRIAGWLKDGKRGKFLSLKISEPRAQQATASNPGGGDLDEEIPFGPCR